MISVEEFLQANPVKPQFDAFGGGDDAGVGEGTCEVAQSSKDQGTVSSGVRHGRRGVSQRGHRMGRRGGFGMAAGVGEGPSDPTDADACREAALCLLDASARSSGGLITRLKAKGYDEDTVTDVVNRLIEVGLVDDVAYAHAMVRYCLSRQLGEQGAIRELVRKGLDRTLASQVVAQYHESGDFVESAYALGRSIAAKNKGMDYEKRRRRLWSAGARKGHNLDLIRQVAQDVFVQSGQEEEQ